MELSEKIQKLRKDQGLTQEQFAEQLFVSRTAVSKWETGRGMPSLESLRLISQIYNVTLDDLLQPHEIIAIAKNENSENINRFVLIINGVFDIAAVMGLFLPLYKINVNEMFYSVPLYQFTHWLAAPYWLLPISIALCGMIQLLIYKRDGDTVKATFTIISLLLHSCAVFVYILSNQPYPTVLFFALLLIKGAVLLITKR